MATLQFTGPPIRRLSHVRSAQPAPCPFCGTSCLVKIWADDPIGDGEGQDARVHCGNCLAEGPVADTIRSAVGAWNIRREVCRG
jgi:hypothetical protein